MILGAVPPGKLSGGGVGPGSPQASTSYLTNFARSPPFGDEQDLLAALISGVETLA